MLCFGIRMKKLKQILGHLEREQGQILKILWLSHYQPSNTDLGKYPDFYSAIHTSPISPCALEEDSSISGL